MPSACNRFQLELLQSIDPESLYLRSSELYLSFLQLAREIINRYTIVSLLQRELNAVCGAEGKLKGMAVNSPDEMAPIPAPVPA